ncbi:MAG: hypothetical protein ACOX41_00480 [Anaerovoracaceae bacterium]
MNICKENNIRFKIRHSMFRSKAEAFVIYLQGRITAQRPCQRDVQVSDREGSISQSSKERLRCTAARMKARTPTSPDVFIRKQEISQQIADELKISRGTVLKYEIFTKCIDSLREKEPEIAAKILSGKLKISHENIIELERLPSRELHALNNTLSKSNIDHITYSDFRHELLWKEPALYSHATNSAAGR